MEQAAFHLADIDLPALLLVGAAAFAASIVGGVSGYGVGLIMPVVLAPVTGIAGVIPAMAVAMALTNSSRVVAFWSAIDRRKAGLAIAGAVPCCFLSAYVYTRLPVDAIAAVLGGCLIASVPLRRYLARTGWRVGERGIVAGGATYGILIGAMTGLGPILIATFMAAGVEGAALIGTDALVSATTNIVKVLVFGGAATLDAELALMGLIVGACTVPGAFAAKWLLRRFPIHIHTAMMEALVLFGGASFIWRAFRG
jgi:uncharacterized membrane protein YfcA